MRFEKIKTRRPAYEGFAEIRAKEGQGKENTGGRAVSDIDNYERPIVTVDAVVLALREGRLHVLLARRAADSKFAPGRWALPGGFIHTDEDRTDEDAIVRVLRTKAGVVPRYMEQLRSFASAKRDSRGWSVSIAYMVIVDTDVEDNDEVRYFPVDDLPKLPFDHNTIIGCAIERVRNKSSYSSLPAFFLPEKFTLSQMQRVYETAMGMKLNTAAFRRKVADQGLVEPTSPPKAALEKAVGRPAQYFRLAQRRLMDMGRAVMTPDTRRGGAR